MDDPILADAVILVLEDDFYLASDLQVALERAGATVIGPFPAASAALAAIERSRPNCALVDINLGAGPSFDIPRALLAAGVPFALVTGYDRQVIPREFAAVPCLEKPITARQAVLAAAQLLAPV